MYSYLSQQTQQRVIKYDFRGYILFVRSLESHGLIKYPNQLKVDVNGPSIAVNIECSRIFPYV